MTILGTSTRCGVTAGMEAGSSRKRRRRGSGLSGGRPKSGSNVVGNEKSRKRCGVSGRPPALEARRPGDRVVDELARISSPRAARQTCAELTQAPGTVSHGERRPNRPDVRSRKATSAQAAGTDRSATCASRIHLLAICSGAGSARLAGGTVSPDAVPSKPSRAPSRYRPTPANPSRRVGSA